MSILVTNDCMNSLALEGAKVVVDDLPYDFIVL